MTRTLTMTAIALAAVLPATAFAQSAGNSQLAAQIGVNADRYSAVELVQLRAELEENNREGVNRILRNAGSELTYDQLSAGFREGAVDLSTRLETSGQLSPAQERSEAVAKAQLAGPLNVDPADFTLSELVELRTARDEGDESVIRAILAKAGVDRTALSVN